MLFISYIEIPENEYSVSIRDSVPKISLFRLPDFTPLRQDKLINNLLMNTNEDLRTFSDGVLIWATANNENKLVINKIGTPKLNDTYDDITYKLTKNDVNEYDKIFKN